MTGWTPIDADGGMKHSNGPAAVRAGDYLFLSSVKGVEPDTQKSDTDPQRQLRQGMANIAVVLGAAGLSMADIVKVTVYLEDPDRNRADLDLVWGETFAGATPPARSTVAVGKVGGAADPTIALFDVVAFCPTDSRS